ncbi:glycoside hydrolase family 2 TIM barrel-domain containing protein [Cesiribacter sp. SM1]|uniref:glycoside hydrolase family 2 TIM barrel-domain containing protein n=1 Tax=Cesiribacter sp. SM1 TaxID=2861196 RepID=UPI001CD57DC1|nr:glycoside hydrolase family 2 TIM barrel-domain containing protein [Cesiribacter sp. SM1]
MKRLLLNALPILLAGLVVQACSNTGQRLEAPTQNVVEGPLEVEIRQQEDGWRLYRGGALYYINGAGGSRYFDELAASGGNSVRTWSTQNAQDILDEAHRRGLTVTLGLDVARERHGFDYNDTAAVAEQLERLRIEVQKYKNHPALLMWGIGNELNLHYTNPKVWDAVNSIARMIHEEDPNHPATTMLAGLNQAEVDLIRTRVPALDLLAVNAYGDLPSVPEKVRSLGWTKPYIVTEWGPTGHWEVAKTAWDAPIEETSSEKAAVYMRRYEASMGTDTEMNLGSYVFLWGQKQERTPTWYGLFTEAGQVSEVADVMQYLWTGSWPRNRAPHLDSMLVDGKRATDNIYLQPGASYSASVYASDPNGDPLSYRWELLPESTDLKEGGDRESRPAPLEGQFTAEAGGQLTLNAPAQEGAYRLFVYVTDGNNKVATANIPFYVKK